MPHVTEVSHTVEPSLLRMQRSRYCAWQAVRGRQVYLWMVLHIYVDPRVGSRVGSEVDA